MRRLSGSAFSSFGKDGAVCECSAQCCEKQYRDADVFRLHDTGWEVFFRDADTPTGQAAGAVLCALMCSASRGVFGG